MLTSKQRVFIAYYLRCWNSAEAARRAGYSERSARQQGSRLLANEEIKSEIRNSLVEAHAGIDEVLVRLTEQARGSIEAFVDVDDTGPRWNFQKAAAAGALGLIRKIKIKTSHPNSDEGTVTVHEVELELHDAQSALALLGRAHKLFTDKMLHGNDPDNPLPEANAAMLAQADQELNAWRKEMIGRLKEQAISPSEDADCQKQPQDVGRDRP